MARMVFAWAKHLLRALNCFLFCLAAAREAVEQEPELLETAETDRGVVAAAAAEAQTERERQATVAMVAVL